MYINTTLLYINAEAVISLPLFTCSFQIWNILQLKYYEDITR
nr:MAG TPA: hypothetical protein [Caudoviricetes sp.]